MNYKILSKGLIVVVILLLLFNFNTCRSNNKKVGTIENLIAYKDSAKTYKSRSNNLVYYNNTLETSLEALKIAKDSLVELVDDLKLKKPKTITKVVTETEYVNIFISHTDTLPCDTFEIDFEYKDPWLSLNGVSNNKGLIFESIKTIGDLSIITGEKKNGFFKRNESVVSVVSGNPYLKVKNLSHYEIKPKIPFYDKWWFKFAIFGGGVLVGTQL